MAGCVELVMIEPAACSDEPETDPPRLRLRSARALFEALTSSDAATRLSALQAVRLSPAAALRFGLHEGRDVIDVLLTQVSNFQGQMERFTWIGTLAAFRDRRVVRLFTHLLQTEQQADLLFALAEYLRTEPRDSLRSELTPALLQNESPVRARAVASLLLGVSDGSIAEQLRIGLLEAHKPSDAAPNERGTSGDSAASGESVVRSSLENNGDFSFPLFSAASAAWLSELHGPFQPESRSALRCQGNATLASLQHYWDRLSETNREWLIEWAADEQEETIAISLIQKALASASRPLTRAALNAAANLRCHPGDLNALISPYLSDPDETIRRAAVCSCSNLDWRALFQAETSFLVRQACIRRLVACEGIAAIPDLIGYLHDPHWSVRAAAAEELTRIGSPGIRASIQAHSSANEAARAAIARMLIAFGDEDLLPVWLAAMNTAEKSGSPPSPDLRSTDSVRS